MHIPVESIEKREVLRMLNVRDGMEMTAAMDALVDRCIETTLTTIRPQGIYKAYTISHAADGIQLNDTTVTLTGGSIARFFEGVEETVYVMAATVGPGMDRLIRSKMVTAPEEGVIYGMCGAVAVEAAADQVEASIRAAVEADGKFLTGRYSPGYGDLPLELQPAILSLLDTSRRIGLMVTAGNLMTPSKSVTAVLGVRNSPVTVTYNRCDDCKLRFNCALRKAGKRCWK